MTVDIRNIYIGFYGEDGTCIRIQIPYRAPNQICASFIEDERKRTVYLQDGSIFYGNGAIISAQHGSMGEIAVFSVECAAGYRSVIIKQTGRKCAALDFMRFSGIAIRPTICYQSIENAIFDDAAFVNNAAFHCIQLAGFIDGVGKSEFVERFLELSLFYRLFSPLYSEMICIFPYFCPYAESARE